MKFHNITKDDMLNGEGLRVVLWVSGCTHHCKDCHNPITWDIDSGVDFDENAKAEIFEQLDKDYINGITLSGGDPLHPCNIWDIGNFVEEIKSKYPNKTIWLYTGFLWEEVRRLPFMQYIDVLVDGKFILELKNVKYHWAGSTNQRVIDVKKSLDTSEVVLYDNK
ncbi:anaerobic ribonucleoside-triphosphate reductase activating protein [Tyzzerella sp. An114]|uniref:anaerobic ribonucleoside-triphosphate reductase activating protein n=1 Tax=Tyzzerella sp. An114 TaxID=1965545 RepID=UPI000B43CFE1|nr:anaerobic ribonucleoside-triphosphate reductase activating protein [Tyzzerella sp. An114]OUQ59916.1 anaerobic ribonucleoside-triphosphate reductase activating protein [Tyzzerella sp. An114]